MEEHAYQLFLAVEDIDHSKTKARSPQTNGICERFHKTMKSKFYDIAFRKKIYHTVDELQQDVDAWLVTYNEQRPHSGPRCYGKTPMQTFNDGKALAVEKQLETHYQVVENKVQLAKSDETSSEVSSRVGSIAPSAEYDKNHHFQGANRIVLEISSDLDDKQPV